MSCLRETDEKSWRLVKKKLEGGIYDYFYSILNSFLELYSPTVRPKHPQQSFSQMPDIFDGKAFAIPPDGERQS